jgi:AcrR family transcriptional regulator
MSRPAAGKALKTKPSKTRPSKTKSPKTKPLRKLSSATHTPPTSMRGKVRSLKTQMLLQAASEVFYEFGYHSATVDMITARLSGSKAIFYYNYKDKQAVLEAIYEKTMADAEIVVKNAISKGGSPVAMLSRITEDYSKWVMDNRLLVGVFWREERNLSTRSRAKTALRQREFDQLIADVLKKGIEAGEFDKGDAQLRSRAISGMITFTYTWWRHTGRIGREELVKEYIELVLRLAGYKQSTR